MSTTEYKTATSTVRIHDELCAEAPEHLVEQLSFIVSESYKRRRGEMVFYKKDAQ